MSNIIHTKLYYVYFKFLVHTIIASKSITIKCITKDNFFFHTEPYNKMQSPFKYL